MLNKTKLLLSSEIGRHKVPLLRTAPRAPNEDHPSLQSTMQFRFDLNWMQEFNHWSLINQSYAYDLAVRTETSI